MSEKNFMKVQFASVSANESFARIVVAAFASQLDPTMDELTDIKTVVSEAVTNAIIHGYEENPEGTVTISARIDGDILYITVEDEGRGIEDLELARTPLYTSKPELERSGMGFTIMENFMDRIEIASEPGKGTKVEMAKRIESKKVMYN
jgi:stage II sporulation protein AB (anti-sigma F factor)